MEDQLAFWSPPQENPNFVSRPPDPGFGSFLANAGWDSIYHSPFNGVSRLTELGIAKTGALNGVVWDMENGLSVDQNLADRQAGKISAADATKKYGLDGQLTFDESITNEAASLMYDRKVAENDRAYLAQTGATTGFRQAAGFAVGMASSLVDPLNVASMFVPVVGEAQMASLVARYGMTRARLISGAVEGLTGAAMAEPFVLLPALQEQANYGLADSAMNLGFGAVLGAGLHAGLGAAGDYLKSLKPREANAIFESAMNDVLQDRPVAAPAKVVEFTDTFENSNALGGETITVYRGEQATLPKGVQTDSATGGWYTTDKAAAESIARSSDGGKLYSLEIPKSQFEAWNKAATEYNGEVGWDGEVLVPHEFRSSRQLISEAEVTGSSGMFARNLLSPKPQPSLNDIPLRDAKGKFLSKQKRLELLNERINAEKVSGTEQRGDLGHDNTQTVEPRVNPDIPPKVMDASEVTKIDSEIADLEAEFKKSAELSPIEHVRKVGDQQRDIPETVMLASQRRIQESGGPALLADAMEHIGDLSNRASRSNSIGNVKEKVDRFLRYLKLGDFANLTESVKTGAEYKVLDKYGINDKFWEMAKAGDPSRFDMKDAAIAKYANEIKVQQEKINSETKAALADYTKAHEGFNPVTKLQTLGKEAAVLLGKQDFPKLEAKLKEIKGWLDEYGALKTEAEQQAKLLEGYSGKPKDPTAFDPQSRFEELTKDIGNPADRQKAVEAATNCIISQLI